MSQGESDGDIVADVRAAAARRASSLSPGMNLPGWFWSGGASSPLGSGRTRVDLLGYRSLGVRGVRIPVDLDLVAPTPPAVDDHVVAQLIEKVESCIELGFAVIVDLHNAVPEPVEGGLSARLQHDPEFRSNVEEVWRRFATGLSQLDPERLLFEPVNEPLFTDPHGSQAIWTDDVAPSLIHAIRSAAPHHTIVVGGPNAAAPRELPRLDSIRLVDDNLVFGMHMYEPYPFTHQGASWAPAAIAARRGVRFSGEDSVVSPIEDELDVAIDWATARAVPMLVTEFGAYRAAPSPDREIWTRVVRTHLERRAVPWMAWTDRSGFGFEREDGALDRGMLNALGLAESVGSAW